MGAPTRSSDAVGIDPVSLQVARTLAERLPVAVIATDATGIVEVWSRGAEDLYGWSADECRGSSIGGFTIHPLDHSVAAGIMSQVTRGQMWAGRYHARNRRGEVIEVYVIDVPLVADDGRVTGILGLSTRFDPSGFEHSRWLALRQMAEEVNLTRERERTYIAGRLHDDVAQVIAMTRMELAEITQRDDLPADVRRQTTRVLTDLDLAQKATRELSNEMFLHDFDAWQLVLRLFDLTDEMQTRGTTAATCDIDVPVAQLRSLSPQVAYAMYNVAREAMSNVRRHAASAFVRVALSADAGRLRLVVEDDGVGVGEAPDGIGRTMMRDRMRSVAGSLEIVDRVAEGRDGTRVVAEAPLEGGAPR